MARILFAHAENSAMEPLINQLKQEYEVVSADSGEDVLRLLLKDDDFALLMFVDCLPDGSTEGLLSKLKKAPRFADTPFVLLTDDAEKENCAFALGAADCLSQGAAPEAICRRIQTVIDAKQAQAYLAERDRTIEKMQFYARHDELTGIYNQRAFCEKTSEMLQLHPSINYVLLCFDILQFKMINDLFGKETGDMILRELAYQFGVRMEEQGTYGRLSGDCFACCFPEKYLNPAQIEMQAQQCFLMLPIEYEVLLYFGIYRITERTIPVDLMCDRANLALQTVKGNHLKRYAFYEPSLRDTLLSEHNISSEMEAALANEQFEVIVQPVFSITTGRAAGGEALVRWRHPAKGVIAPAEFIPLFERTGFITKLDRFIWEKVCAFQRQLLDQGIKPLPISVNVSRIDFYNTRLCDTLIGLIQKYRLDPGHLRLEVTESAYIDNPQQLMRALETLHRHGFPILIDDFGSGYSSLNMIKDVPADILKIDMAFVHDVEQSERAGSVLGSVMRLARWLEMDVIAEGVENEGQRSFLKSIGCDAVQGSYYAMGMPLSEFAALVQGGNDQTSQKTVQSETVHPEQFWREKENATRLIGELGGAVALYELCEGGLEMLRVNEAYYTLTGSSPKTILRDSKDSLAWVHEQDRERLIEVCQKAKQNRTNENTLVRRYAQDGSLLWLCITVQYLGEAASNSVFCFLLAEMTKGEDAISTLMIQQWADVLRLAFDDVAVIDAKQDRMFSLTHDSNMLFAVKPGLSYLAARQKFADQVVHPEDRDVFLEMYEPEKLLAHTELRAIEIRLLKTDGEYHSVRMCVMQVQDLLGRTIIMSGIQSLDELKKGQLTQRSNSFLAEREKQDLIDLQYEPAQDIHTNAVQTVLIVDDNRVNRMMLRKMLSDSYRILEAENGKQALDILEQQGEVAAILLDIVMPVMNGHEFLRVRAQNQRYCSIPVIVLSQSDTQEDELRALELGANDFVKKPYEPAIIRQRLVNLIRLRRMTTLNNTTRAIINHLPGGIAVLEVGRGVHRMQYMSDGFATMCGYTKEEFNARYGQDFRAIIYKPDREHIKKSAMEAVGQRVTIDLQLRVCHADGAVHWTHMMANHSFSTSEDTEIYFAVFTDIDAQKRAEADLEDANRKYEIAVAQSRLQIWEYNIPQDILHIPAQAAERLHLPREMPDIFAQLQKQEKLPNTVWERIRELLCRVRQGEMRIAEVLNVAREDKQEICMRITCSLICDKEGKPRTAIGVTREVTEEVLARRQYEREAAYRRSLEALALSEFDLQTGARVDDASGDTLGPAIEVFLTRLVHPEDRALFSFIDSREKMLGCVQSGDSSEAYIECRIHSEKETFAGWHWVSVTFSFIMEPENGHPHVFICIKDIHERRAHELEMIDRAQRDPLTCILNRASFEELTTQALTQTRDGISAFFILDLDNFKGINDTYGHQYGDEVLRHVANRLSKLFRAHDIVARLGGDEMVAFMTNVPSIQIVEKKGTEICRTMSRWRRKDEAFCLTCSVGIALAPEQGEDFDTLYQHADLALYEAKQQGKNQWHIYNTESTTPHMGEWLGADYMTDFMGVPLYISDTQTHEMLYMNRTMMQHLGIDNYRGQKCYQVLRGRDTPCPACTNHLLSYTDFFTCVGKGCDKGLPIRKRIKLITWGERTARMEYWLDLEETEQRKALERVKARGEDEEKCKILMQYTDLRSFDYDLRQDTITYNTRDKAGAPLQKTITGFSEKLPNMQNLSEKSRETILERLKHAVRFVEQNWVMLETIGANGAMQMNRCDYASIADEHGRVYRIVGRIQDERQQLTEENFAQVVAFGVPGALFRIRYGETHELQFANDAFYEIHGFTRESFPEQYRKDLAGTIHPQDRDEVKKKIRAANAEYEKTISFDMRIIRPNREVRWIRLGMSFSYENEEVYGNGGMFDITEWK